MLAMPVGPGNSLAATKSRAKPAAAAAAPVDAAAQKQKDAAAAHNAYDAGVKSYQTSKLEPAVQSFTAALRGGGLAPTDMAHALYYRGLAYKKQSKPGLAISDLTSALWLKNGLSDSERASATAERAEAYRMAGLGDGNTGAEQVAVADPNPPAANTKAAPSGQASAAPAQIPVAAETPAVASKASRSSDDIASLHAAAISGISAPAAKSAPVPRPVETKSTSTESTQTDQLLAGVNQNAARTESIGSQVPVLSASPVETAAAVPAPIPAAAAASSTPNSVTGFFSDLFGGNSSPQAAQAPITTASTNTAATLAASSVSNAGPVTAAVANKSAQAKGVQQKGVQQVATHQTAAAPQAQLAAAPPVIQAAAPQVKGGKFKVHIAALRSRAEADALAQKLVQQHGNQLLNRAPTVDEAVIGSMGTFYRVRVGSFATAEESRGLCNTLRTSGFDCLVVTN